MKKRKTIGYQITNGKCEVPEGLWSFQIFHKVKNAYAYCREHGLGNPWYIETIREGDVEEPTYID